MEHWNNKYGSHEILNISYEDLINKKEATLKNVFNFIEVPFSESCYDFYKKDTSSITNSFAIRTPINTDRLDRFKHYRDFFKDDNDTDNTF